MSHPSSEYMPRYLAPLVGCKVVEVKDSGYGFVSLVFDRADGEKYSCMLSSDEEGNAPGWLYGLPRPVSIREKFEAAKRKARK